MMARDHDGNDIGVSTTIGRVDHPDSASPALDEVAASAGDTGSAAPGDEAIRTEAIRASRGGL